MRIAAALLMLLLGSASSAQACTQTYIMFFDDGSSELTARGMLVTAEFARIFYDRRDATPAERMLSCGPLPLGEYRVEVWAHAQDRSTQDQCGLSRTRGEVVRARLAELGIPDGSLRVIPFGDRALLLPTQPGETDPQNRYVSLRVFTATDPSLERRGVEQAEVWGALAASACP